MGKGLAIVTTRPIIPTFSVTLVENHEVYFNFQEDTFFFRGAFGRKINMHKQGRVMERQCYLQQWLCMSPHFYTVPMHNTCPSVIALMKRTWAGIPFEKNLSLDSAPLWGHTYHPPLIECLWSTESALD